MKKAKPKNPKQMGLKYANRWYMQITRNIIANAWAAGYRAGARTKQGGQR